MKPYWEGWLFSAKDAEGGKPLRALIIRRLRILLPKIHNLLELVEGLRDGGLPVNEVIDYLRDLNSYYLVSRFPDAANGVPSEARRKMDERCVEVVTRMGEEVTGILRLYVS